MEWWIWSKQKRGTHTLSEVLQRRFTADIDYRSRVCLHSDWKDSNNSPHGNTFKTIRAEVGDVVRSCCTGSMAMFSTLDRWIDSYEQLLITPPLFHIDTIVVDEKDSHLLGSEVQWLTSPTFPLRYPVWFQPWLHQQGVRPSRSLLRGRPYDDKRGHGMLDLSMIQNFGPYRASVELRERLAVAMDACMQLGQADERFR